MDEAPPDLQRKGVQSFTYRGYYEVIKDASLLVVDDETESIAKKGLEFYLGREGIVDKKV